MASIPISRITEDVEQISNNDLLIVSKNNGDNTFTTAKITGEKLKQTVKIGIGSASTSTDGLMTATDKSKLDSIQTGATKVIVDNDFNIESTNPVQNKKITGKINEIEGKVTSLETKIPSGVSFSTQNGNLIVTIGGTSYRILVANGTSGTVTTVNV